MKLLKSLKGKVKRICGKYYVFKYKQRIKNNMNLIGRYGTFRFISEFSVEDFKRIKNVKVIKWDERLTTVSAYKTMRELNISQKKKNIYADKLAATYILESYLNSL